MQKIFKNSIDIFWNEWYIILEMNGGSAMAKEKKETKVTNKPRVHGVSLVGTILTGSAAAAALALPFLGIGGGLVMVAAGGVFLASATGFAIFRGKKRKAEKLGLKKGKVRVKETIEEKEYKEENKEREDLKERIANLSEVEDKNIEAAKIALKEVNKYSLEDYMVDKVGAKTFAIYEADGKTIKTDSHGKPMIYAIENNKEYRMKLFNYISSKTSGDCVIEIVDANGKSEKQSISAKDYSSEMGMVMTKIGEVARQTVVHEPPAYEA